MARIVVLQEIQANLRRVRRSLEPIGHLVIGFSSQSVAVAYLKNQKVDLIISAVHLDEGNVFDFLKWSRSHPTNRSTPFVFFCAEPTEFGKHVFGAVKSAGELLGVSKYILMETFDAIQFRCEIAKLLALHPANDTPIQEQWFNLSPNVRAPEEVTQPVTLRWQMQDFSVSAPVTSSNLTESGSDGDGAARNGYMKDKEHQDHN